jgi:hypothetical protein
VDEGRDSTRASEAILPCATPLLKRLAEVTRQLDDWADQHMKTTPSLMDVARFEGLRAERMRLLAEFGEREDRFVVELLKGSTASTDDLVVDVG